ncbi:MAG: flavin reductase family protein [Clostridia bacterium]|nr:flavin reductase family protein [Clostridia bacterium]
MSRKNFGAKPLSLPQPVWIIATYDENGVPDAMNAAWGGVSEEKELSVCLSPSHKTCKNFALTGAFTVSMADRAHVAGCDYVGMASGNQTADKFVRAGFTATKSAFVNAPVINELAVCIECRVKSYDRETCILKGEIVNVSVDEAALTDGVPDAEKIAPLCFDPFTKAYRVIGEKVGEAWSSGKAIADIEKGGIRSAAEKKPASEKNQR